MHHNRHLGLAPILPILSNLHPIDRSPQGGERSCRWSALKSRCWLVRWFVGSLVARSLVRSCVIRWHVKNWTGRARQTRPTHTRPTTLQPVMSAHGHIHPSTTTDDDDDDHPRGGSVPETTPEARWWYGYDDSSELKLMQPTRAKSSSTQSVDRDHHTHLKHAEKPFRWMGCRPGPR
jgi:hypothetical protein